MGARFGDQCFADPLKAAEAECAQVAGVTSAGHLRCTSASGTVASPTLNFTLVGPGGALTTYTAGVRYGDCDPFEGYADLAQMYGLALVALVGVWCVKQFVLKLVLPQ
jgi:hypothetical protein